MIITKRRIVRNSIKDSQEKSIYFEKAMQLYVEGKYAEALKKLQFRDKNTSDELKIFKLLTRLYANLGNFSEAEKCSRESLQLDLFDPECYYLQGLLLLEKGDSETAKKSFFKAIYLDPDFELSHYAVANCRLHSGNVIEAEKIISDLPVIKTRSRKSQ